VKKAAVDIVRDLTGSEDGLHSLSNYANTVLPLLSRLLSDDKEVSEPAAEALVNLSQNAGLAAKMVEMGLIKIAMDMLYKPGSSITRLLVMLLVNLTQLDDGISSLLQIGDDKMRGLYVMKLVRSFCRSSETSASHSFVTPLQDDPFDHVGSILVNISKKEEGRKMLLDPKRGLLKQIIRQFDSSSLLRKKGVSGTIRNCCFEAENQLQNLLLISEFLWPALLLPVAGNKIYGEQDTSKMPLELGSALSIDREPVKDPEIRVQALEAIYLIALQVKIELSCAPTKLLADILEEDSGKFLVFLLRFSGDCSSVPSYERLFTLYEFVFISVKGIACMRHKIFCSSLQEAGRRALWSVNGPRILQVGYEDEEDPKVMEAYEQIGSLLVHGSESEEPSTTTSK
ncbi:hypothetical protein Gotri_008257, partial [Gossypium trilobum]|nr:hypothetical protein [Gossypium trilobum]